MSEAQAWVANARMYAVAPGAAAAWGALLAEVGARAAVPLTIIDHAFPATLPELWHRPDLGCAFICGWPLALEDQARSGATPPVDLRPILAAPVPDATWSAGTPRYRSDFVVAVDAPFRTIADAGGRRFAFNALHSHSGANMPRAKLADLRADAPLFAEFVGPLTTPRRCIEAVVEGRAEITALDSYALQLLARHDPALAAAVRMVGTSDPSPIPLLVGSPGLPDSARRSLRAALTRLHEDGTGRALLADLCLLRFEPVDRERYAATLAVEQRAAAVRFGPAGHDTFTPRLR